MIGTTTCGRRARRVECDVLIEHGPLEVLELTARFEPELLDQHAPGVGVGLERLRLAAGTVERQHQLRARPLA